MDELLDHAPCGFLSFGDDGAITLINATLLERLGYERDALLGRHVETILTIPGRLFYQTHLFPMLRLHGVAQEVFLLLRSAGGDAVGVLCNAVRRERGGVPANDCIFLEVVERRKFEEALLQAKQAAERANAELEARTHELMHANAQLEEQAVELEVQHQQLQEQAAEMQVQQDQLQVQADDLVRQADELERQRIAADEANRAKSAFLATMSHELRTPLNAIGGYLQLLQMGVHGPLQEAQQQTLERIDRSQRHLLGLINDVLNLSRIEAGRVEYAIESFPVAEVVGNIHPMVEPQAETRGVRFEVDVAGSLTARADRDKVQQILINLLSNAIKFTPRGGVIRIEGDARDGDQPAVLLRVADTGTGIPPDMIERIFEPFVQVPGSERRTGEGTGLGLAISRDLARGMGGDLAATSTPGVGSTFTLTLPDAGHP